MDTGYIIFRNGVFHSIVAEKALDSVLAQTDATYLYQSTSVDPSTLLDYSPEKYALSTQEKYGTALEVIAKYRFPKLFDNGDDTVSTLEDIFSSPNDYYFEEYTEALPPDAGLKYVDVTTCRLVNDNTHGTVTDSTIKCVSITLEQLIDSHTLVNFTEGTGVTEGTIPTQDATLISYGLSPVNKLIDRVFAQQMQDNQQEYLVQSRLDALGQPNTLVDVQSEFELYYGEVTRLKDEAAAGLVSVDKYWEYVSKLLDALKNKTEMDHISLDPITQPV